MALKIKPLNTAMTSVTKNNVSKNQNLTLPLLHVFNLFHIKVPYTINNIRKTYNSLVLSLGIRYLLTIVGFYETHLLNMYKCFSSYLICIVEHMPYPSSEQWISKIPCTNA